LQVDLNFFSEHFLKGHGPIREDGFTGPQTHRRIRIAKYQLGYNQLTQEWTDKQRKRLHRPKDSGLASAAVIARGKERRIKQRDSWEDNIHAAVKQAGVTIFDGKPCAKWLVPYLQWARSEGGWRGRMESGYRTPQRSEDICLEQCGKPSCPGRCAGRSSHHSQDRPPHGAIDVTEHVKFGQAMRRCPLQPRIFNAVPEDPIHFSATGN
ncbi:MAG: hypothetical protein WBC33_09620, partial [Conexibacter sp.]